MADLDRCPLRKAYGEIICIDGTLWTLTYSECAPPDQRQAVAECDYCKKKPGPVDRKTGEPVRRRDNG